MILAACSGVTSKEIVLAEIDLPPSLSFLQVQHVVDREDLDVLQDGSRDGFIDAAVEVADQMDHHVDAIAGENQVAAAAYQIDFDGNDAVADGNHGGGALWLAPLAKSRLSRIGSPAKSLVRVRRFSMSSVRKIAPTGILSFGHGSSLRRGSQASAHGNVGGGDEDARLSPVARSPFPLVIT